MNTHISDYIDAIYHMDCDSRYKNATETLMSGVVKPGTAVYYELARIRFQARKEMQGISNGYETFDTFKSERDAHESTQGRAARRSQ